MEQSLGDPLPVEAEKGLSGSGGGSFLLPKNRLASEVRKGKRSRSENVSPNGQSASETRKEKRTCAESSEGVRYQRAQAPNGPMFEERQWITGSQCPTPSDDPYIFLIKASYDAKRHISALSMLVTLTMRTRTRQESRFPNGSNVRTDIQCLINIQAYFHILGEPPPPVIISIYL
jgi:hypothetical protein